MLKIRNNIKGIKRRIDYKYFDYVTRHVKDLPTIAGSSEYGFSLVTMLCHRDVSQYMIAVNSLYDYLMPERFVIINDGSLDSRDASLLRAKVDRCEIYDGASFLDRRLPTYSSWQRIQAIATLLEESYVVQMDADIMVVADIEEVNKAIASNHPFMLGTDEGPEIVSAREAKEFAQQFYDEEERHVQCVCEINLDAFPKFDSMKYIRGCAGFSGFPRHGFSKEDLLEISAIFSARLGEKWPVWGSEQAASNLLLANMKGVQVLPLRFYDSVERYSELLKLVHFIGSCRFDGGVYRDMARKFLSRKIN